MLRMPSQADGAKGARLGGTRLGLQIYLRVAQQGHREALSNVKNSL